MGRSDIDVPPSAGRDTETLAIIMPVLEEEVSLNRLFPGQALNTREPPPGTYATWSRSI